MKKISYKVYLIYIWAFIVILSIIITIFSSTKKISKVYDLEVEATNLSKACMNEISNHNKDMGMDLNEDDIYSSYLIGTNYKNLITTTYGSIESKLTSLDPNFAALFVKMFYECGLEMGDEIALTISGSFPGLNISALCAIEVMGLKSCVFSSIGSSQLGANNPDFVFPEWVDLLYSKGYLSKRVDYVSYGGEYDTIDGFYDYTIINKSKSDEERLTDIKNRLVNSGLEFIEIDDYNSNINYRMELISKNLPNLKVFLNIGGNIIGLGKNQSSKYFYRGIIEPNYLKISSTYDRSSSGLLERYLVKGITCISMLNLKGICADYNMKYNQALSPTIDTSLDIYYDVAYNKTMPIIALSISFIILSLIVVFSIISKKKEFRNE